MRFLTQSVHHKNYHGSSSKKGSRKKILILNTATCLCLCCLLSITIFYTIRRNKIPPTCHHGCGEPIHLGDRNTHIRKDEHQTKRKVFTGLRSINVDPNTPLEVVGGKIASRLQLEKLVSFSPKWESVQMHIPEQRHSMKQVGHLCYTVDDTDTTDERRNEKVLELFDSLVAFPWSVHLGQELWKYCMLAVELKVNSSSGMAAYLDIDSPILSTFEDLLDDPMKSHTVIADERFYNKQTAMHGSLLVLHKKHESVASGMVEAIIQAGRDTLLFQPDFIPKKLASFISIFPSTEWCVFQQRCHFQPHEKNYGKIENVYHRNAIKAGNKADNQQGMYTCPNHTEYCCDIVRNVNSETREVKMMTRNAILPYHLLPPASQSPPPLGEIDVIQNAPIDEWWYITKIREEATGNQKEESTNAHDLVWEPKCAREQKHCKSCLKANPGNCQTCSKECPCFCTKICKVNVPEKVVGKILHYYPPEFKRDPNRLIPRIVHQTYFEPIAATKYPNFSRFIESWKQNGWDYRFYSDVDARNLLATHFPAEVLDAFDSLLPGAFKADLFRYCALFIFGGIYADIDVLSEVKLDEAIDADIGFMVPFDSPTTVDGKHTCLWNGLIASAPGHPYLAEAIQTIVTNVRNRFTSVDVMNSFCPDYDLALMDQFDILFTAGPCLLGASVNKVLGRRALSNFEGDELITSKLVPPNMVPGRTIILAQNKAEMGAHRFLFTHKNLLFAGTDFQNYDDRVAFSKDENQHEHYSKLHKEAVVYGMSGLYHDRNIANEKVIFALYQKEVDNPF